jgi:O-antigen/teichoic acid export membrane protein
LVRAIIVNAVEVVSGVASCSNELAFSTAVVQADAATAPLVMRAVEGSATDMASLVLRGLVIQLAGRAVGLVLSLVTLTLTIRYLGASDYGLLVTVVAFAGLFESFVDLGVGTVIVRRVSGGSASLERLVGLNLSMSLAYAIPLWALAMVSGVVVYSGRPTIQLGIAIVAIGLMFRALSTCYVPIYETAVRFGALTVSDVTSRGVALALTVAAIQHEAGVVALMSIQVVAPLIALITLLLVARRRGDFRPIFEPREALELLRESVPLAGLHVVAVFYFRADGVLLSLLSSSEEVGSYGLAYRVVGNAAIVATLFVNSAFSTMSRSWAEGRAAFNAVVSRSVNFMLLCAAPLVVFGIALGPSVVQLIASESYTASAGRATQLLSGAIAAGYINLVLSQALIAAHKQRYLVFASPLALVFNIALNLVLVPPLGAEGAGIALICTEVCSMLAAGAWLYRATRYPIPLGFLVRLLPPVALTVAALWVTRQAPVLLRITVPGIVYATSVLVAGPVRLNEMKVLLGRRRKIRTVTRVEEADLSA